ncbi:MAG: Phenylacetic acid catabolic protein [Candidatus Palauibacterales bacterium]|nr:Phenylacetic acid catabolic protein [Candidatus Palauibacterales bacterium]MDP2529764.1 Phenylacetic acid catabolic protein [Candidatus Palauibacterales bacterium]MDP2585119.1 Phenylacetic acid catabolic protein [Candidatus Palauibacterales bacterium]
MARFTDEELQRKVKDGFIVESEADMTEGYKKALITQLTVQGDTELISAPAYFMAARDAPSTNTMVSATAIIQDELGHANIAYRLLEDLGIDRHWLLYERPPEKFKHPYGFDQPLENWAELVTANGLYDRAGITLLGDVYRNTSYGPLKRALVKVDMEENFHLRHGEVWMRRLAESGGEARDAVQRTLDWMFPMGVEWFGMPDDKKRHNAQLDFKLKGMTNDQLRQTWLKAVVPLCHELGLDVPAHVDPDTEEVELEFEFPCQYDPDARRWLFEDTITWDEVWDRWRGRGPMNQQYVDSVRKSRYDVEGLLAA